YEARQRRGRPRHGDADGQRRGDGLARQRLDLEQHRQPDAERPGARQPDVGLAAGLRDAVADGDLQRPGRQRHGHAHLPGLPQRDLHGRRRSARPRSPPTAPPSPSPGTSRSTRPRPSPARPSRSTASPAPAPSATPRPPSSPSASPRPCTTSTSSRSATPSPAAAPSSATRRRRRATRPPPPPASPSPTTPPTPPPRPRPSSPRRTPRA